VVRNPDGQSWEDAAASWMQYATAWGGLIACAGLTAGDHVLLPAASSSVGLAAIQVANLVGAVPIAMTRTFGKKAELLEAGAAHVVVTGDGDWASQILELTSGKGARVAFDPVGGPDFPGLLSATAKAGTVVAYGALSPEVTPLPIMTLADRDQNVRGFVLTSAMRDDTMLGLARDFVLERLASGALKPRIARTFPFDRIVDAHRLMEANTHTGKIVVTVSGDAMLQKLRLPHQDQLISRKGFPKTDPPTMTASWP
jgi:NADPH:quinone reductase-like Zn-dependent oxidoreductase